VDAPYATEPLLSEGVVGEEWNDYLTVAADDDGYDAPLTVDNNRDLPPRLSREFGKVPSELRGDDLLRCYAAVVDLPEPL
jgi:hypothetical protein